MASLLVLLDGIPCMFETVLYNLPLYREIHSTAIRFKIHSAEILMAETRSEIRLVIHTPPEIPFVTPMPIR